MRRRYCVFFLILMSACIEPFDIGPEIEDSGSILVVEATLTNEMKKHQIILSRTIPVGTDSIVNFDAEVRFVPSIRFDSVVPTFVVYERNANVIITNGTGHKFLFFEVSPGTYESTETFQAEENMDYTLDITTSSGENYRSTAMSISGRSQLDSVYSQRTINSNGEEGMAIYVDGSDPNGTSNHFRYEYEETYKIIAPKWTPYEFEILNDGSVMGEVPAVQLVPRVREEQVCYNTVSSSDIIVENTSNLGMPDVQNKLVRFITRDNPIISHRYSILVKQYSQSLEAFDYYQTLGSFASSENVFSQVQPGFIEGNVDAINHNNMVLGFFDVVAVDQKRLFFNYADFFPGEPLPPYFQNFDCERLLSPKLGDPERDGPSPPPPGQCPQPLIPRLKLELVEYYLDNSIPPDVCEGPYFVTPRICGDCTILGSNVPPDFWTE